MELLLMILPSIFMVAAAVNPPWLARKINITLEVIHDKGNINP